MNFVAIIGIIESVIANSETRIVITNIKVEKLNTANDDQNWFDLLPVSLDQNIFQTEINQFSEGTIVGIKGRAINIDGKLTIVAERAQVF